MFCADRCVICGLGEAVDLALRFPADAVGVVVDTYHVEVEIFNAGIWDTPADQTAATVRERFAAVLGARPGG